MEKRWLWLVGIALLAGSVAPNCVIPRREPPAISPATPSDVAAPTTPPPQRPLRTRKPRPLPPREDERGVLGAPIDETGFDFEPEVSDLDVPPVVTGADPISPRIAASLRAYLESRRARLASVSPSPPRMVVLTRLGDTVHAHLVTQPMGARTQITFGPEPVQQAAFDPNNWEQLVYRSDTAGTENFQIFQVNIGTRALSRISDGKSRSGPFRIAPKGEQIAYATNQRSLADMDVVVAKLQAPHTVQLQVERDGQHVPLAWSRDGARLAVQHYLSKTSSGLYLLAMNSGAMDVIAEATNDSAHVAATFSPEDRFVYVLSNRTSDFQEVHRYELRRRAWKSMTPDVGWDVEEMALSGDGRWLAVNVNEDGYSRLFKVDTKTLRRQAVKNIPAGVVSGLRFVGKGLTLAFSLNLATEPTDAYTLDLTSQKLTRWTQSETGGVPRSRFVEPSLIRYESFDGTQIPAFVYRSPGDDPSPALLWMHGGPEDQSRPGFDPIIQYLVTQLGITVIAPNVRGSEGYGKAFLGLDDAAKRGDAIRDVGALLDWIDAQPWLDSARVGIYGASYGGFMVLASLAEYPERFAAGCDVVGMSNLVTFLENTSSYRQDLRRVEYGDERDERIRERLLELSPMTRVHRIKAPLLVAHGAQDPRVPVEEAQSIVEAVRAQGVNAWYMEAQDEGHSFKKRHNRDTFYQLMATFLDRHLVSGTSEPEDRAGTVDVAPDAGP